jgi:hypothetical protein
MAAIPAASPDPRARQRGLLVLPGDTFLAILNLRGAVRHGSDSGRIARIRAHDSAACWCCRATPSWPS